MPFCQLFYHLVWATKNRHPLLTPEIEPIIYDYLRAKAIGLGATVFALNGIEDHVHMVASIPPKLAVSTFIGQIKGVAATKFNKSKMGQTPLYWQDEYGAFTFDAKRLPNYIAYVERQKEHHARGTLIPILERSDGDSFPRLIREPAGLYWIEDNDWRCELETLEALMMENENPVPSQ